MGYDPQRHWEAGDRPADVFVLGDFQSSLDTQNLNLDQISQVTGLDLSQMKISEVPFLQGRSVAEVAEATPALKDFTMEEIPALDGLGLDSSMTLGEAMEMDPSIGEMDFSAIAGDSAVTDVPNLDLASMDSFEDWQATAISEVPGLGDIPMGSMPNGLGILSGLWGKFDMPYGPKEHTKTKTKYSITGSNKDGFTVQCGQPRGCAHIELSGFFQMHGAQWISGGTGPGQQMVNGGEGVLGTVNGGKEPTGRHPYGDQFKIVLDEVSESEGSAKFALYFKYCYRGPPVDLGCTPYFLGPVPMPVLDAKEKGLIITGLLDGRGGLTSGLQAPESWEKKRPKNTAEIDDIVGKYAQQSPYGSGSLCGDGPGGVKFEALGEAYHAIESRGSGDYGAVGVFVSLSYGETGRALGRYQYMSYRSDIQQVLRGRPGGSNLLEKARIKGATITAQELLEVFPPDIQNTVFRQDQTYMIDLALSRGYTGDRLLEVLAQMHFRGPGVLDSSALDSKSSTNGDSLGTTMYDYGQRFRHYYREAESKVADGSEDSRCKATGNFIHPIIDGLGIFTSPFGMRYHPKSGEYRLHAGDDIGVGVGTPVVASDGGVIEHRTQGPPNGNKGYGWYIILKHGNGVETWYAHLSKRIAKNGSRVAQGDVIGEVGGLDGMPGAGTSTGAHLHFEVRINGEPLKPGDHVDYSRTTKDL